MADHVLPEDPVPVLPRTFTTSSASNIFVSGDLLQMCETSSSAQSFTVGSDFNVVFDPRNACSKCGKPVPSYGVFDAISGKGYCSTGCYNQR